MKRREFVAALLSTVLLVGCKPAEVQPELPQYTLKKIGSVKTNSIYEVEIDGHKYLATSTYGGNIVLCPKVEDK